eukprot:Phypoly_transcript_16886.p1 GENE.Phypoly_transcript_16886~~Phypoly_transcript_16886.p1  ORF type:complete len:274 (+),score=41.86 Phypoly_transcript_16886:11-832(+)
MTERGFEINYSKYQHLLIEKKDGIALITINRPDKMNVMNIRLHYEIGQIWKDIHQDPDVHVAVITGAGSAFSAGGDFEMVSEMVSSYDQLVRVFEDTKQLVHSMINCDKPIISAVNGVAVGAGLVVALLADISIVSEKAKLNDGHTRLGVAAGDHACAIWPLLCGMAKAKYYLLTGNFIEAKEAERIGLISACVPHDQVLPKAMEVAKGLSKGPQHAIRFTKNALNQWLRMGNILSFDYSCAMEMINFTGQDVRAGMKAIKDKAPPAFPSAKL